PRRGSPCPSWRPRAPPASAPAGWRRRRPPPPGRAPSPRPGSRGTRPACRSGRAGGAGGRAPRGPPTGRPGRSFPGHEVGPCPAPVHGVDDITVPLVDHAALDLERGRDLAAGLVEVARQQLEVLDGLPAAQAGVDLVDAALDRPPR